jgi:hypothetical protein
MQKGGTMRELPVTRQGRAKALSELDHMRKLPEKPEDREYYGTVLGQSIWARFEHTLSPADRELWESIWETCVRGRDAEEPRGKHLLEAFDEFLCQECSRLGSAKMDLMPELAHRKMRWERTGNIAMIEKYAQAEVLHQKVRMQQAALPFSDEELRRALELYGPPLRILLERYRGLKEARRMPTNKRFASFVERELAEHPEDFDLLIYHAKDLQDFILSHTDEEGKLFASRVLSGAIGPESFLQEMISRNTNYSRRSIQRRLAKAKST